MSLVDRVRALPVFAQIALTGMAALLLVALVAGLWLAMRPRYDVLFNDLRPQDAATIVAELDRKKIVYRLDDGGATILAPADQVDEIRLAVMGADLPLKGTVGFELFNKSDMGLTEFAQRINYQRALQGELARTIMTIEAIDTARVHLTLPEPSIFRAERRPAEASVTLTPRPGRTLTAETVAGIQRLVGASAPELDPAQVVILDASGSLMTGTAAIETVAGDEASALVQQTRAIETWHAATLRRALEPLYPGVRVTVLAPLDQWAIEGDAAREVALDRWAPDRRDFRLAVTVTTPTPASPAQRDDIGRIVEAETGISTARGDAVMFGQAAPVAASVEATRPTPAAPQADTATGSAPVSSPTPAPAWTGWAAFAVLALVAVIWALRRRRPRTLTPAQREAWIRRLNRLMAEEDGHAS